MPTWWWADRGCAIAGVDPAYHGIVWVHERLGWFVAALATLSAGIVGSHIFIARRRLRRLLALAAPTPAPVFEAFAAASRELGIDVPRIAFLDIASHIATTVDGPVILLSRGFVERLDQAELRLVARHELVHVGRGDARTGALVHLAFAALLLPGFASLERRLHLIRERRANVVAARGEEDRYLKVLEKVSGPTLCAEARLGLEAAAPHPEDPWLAWLAPLAVGSLAVALPLSHAAFLHHLPYLLAHHC